MSARGRLSVLVLSMAGLLAVGTARASAQAGDAEEPKEDKAPAAQSDKKVDDENAPFTIEFGNPGVVLQGKRLRLFSARNLQSKHWLGVALAPADETLRAQLGLEGTGVVVTDVVADSPAAKAGLKKNDVVVSVGKTPVGEASDVIKAVDAAGEQPIAVELLRGGKTMSVEVTPQARPAEGPSASFDFAVPPGKRGERFRYNIVRPGAIMAFPPQLQNGFRWFASPGKLPDLPEDLSVSISKTGKEPAQIVVKRGDDKWEVTDEQLDQLPDDVRPLVEQMLGRTPGFTVNLRPMEPQARREQLRQHLQQRRQAARERHAAAPGAQKRLDALSKQVEELQKAIEQLREELPREPSTPEEND